MPHALARNTADVFTVDEIRTRLLNELNEALDPLGGLGRMSLLQEPPKGGEDNPEKVILRNRKGSPAAILFCSRSVAPGYVAEEEQNIARVKGQLGPDLGQVILDPLLTGQVDGLTYSVRPWRQPLSSARWIRRAQRALIRPKVITWLREVVRVTVFSPGPGDLEPDFLCPLDFLSKQTRLASSVRERSRRAIRRLLDGEWRPRYVLDHGDFWLGNVLLDSSWTAVPRLTCQFIVIDWRGASLRGYGFSDLLQFARSTGLRGKALLQECRRHQCILDLSPEDSMAQLLVGLGRLGMNLERFPEDRFVDLVERLYSTFSAIVGEGNV